MKRTLLAALTVAVVAGAAWGQATQPALPPGHMPIDGMGAGMPEGMPALPPGHMPIGGAATMPGLPPGHMPIGGMGAGTQPALPPGHMPIPGMPGAAGGATTQMATKGTLTLQAIAGSAGGKPVANLPVKVQLYSARDGNPGESWTVSLDATGAATIKDVPVREPCVPVITLTHEGLEQGAEGPMLDGAHPDQTFKFKVYEPTAEKPALTVGMQHAIVDVMPDGSGVRITEMLAVVNPSDRAWVGKAGEGGAKETLVMPLPPGATDINLTMGFDQDGTSMGKDGAIHTGSTLFPGQKQLSLNYLVPAENGAVKVPLQLIADTSHLMLVAPAKGPKIQVTGLNEGKTTDLGRGPIRVFQGENLKAGTTLTVDVSGITAVAAAEEAPAGASQSKKFAIVGGLGVVVAGVTVLCLKRPKGAGKKA